MAASFSSIPCSMVMAEEGRYEAEVAEMSIALFCVIGSLGRHMIVANTFGSFAMLVVMALGGYIVSKDHIPTWWLWGFWVSPLMYAQNAASVDEFLGHSWDNVKCSFRE